MRCLAVYVLPVLRSVVYIWVVKMRVEDVGFQGFWSEAGLARSRLGIRLGWWSFMVVLIKGLYAG